MTDDQVRIRTEPTFEMVVEGAVGVSDVRRAEIGKPAGAVTVEAPTNTVTGTSRYAAPTPAGASDMGMDELLAYSRDIESGIKNLTRR